MRFCLPAPLQPGDRVAVVAPSSGFPRGPFFEGLAWLAGRYDVVVRTAVLSRKGYLAGDDRRRERELVDALVDPTVKAIVAARGGYGAMRIVESEALQAAVLELPRSPKWLVGFSDVTALHAVASSSGVCSVHGPNVTGLGGSAASPSVRASFLRALERPDASYVWEGLRVVHDGPTARGPIVGGNLALVCAMAAAGKLAVPDGAVLALEDVTERPYRIDRMLTSLRLGGVLARVSAIVFGSFAQCDPGPDGVSVAEVLADRTTGLGVAVLAGAPFGHDAQNEAFVLGTPVEVGRGTVGFNPFNAFNPGARLRA
jgi:muramoyltetrapeptide carboxypeptidase